MTVIFNAIKPEAKPFISSLQNKRKILGRLICVYQGRLSGAEVMVVQCGVGLDKSSSAARLLMEQYDVSRIIMSGTAGGIDARLDIGDTVVSDEMVFHEPADLQNGNMLFKADEDLLEKAQKAVGNNPPSHPVYFGRISSGNKFVTGKNRDLVKKVCLPLCADMETAAVAQVCSQNSIPFIAIRSISDSRDKSGLLNFFKYVSLASVNSFKVTQLLLQELCT